MDSFAMDDASQKWMYAKQLEKALQEQLRKDHPLFGDIEPLLEDLRIACQDTIFLNFEYAKNEDVENHLWTAHTNLNNRYRKYLAIYRSGDQNRRVVERRKLEKHYVDFIKKSQFFYKGYIQRLASHFTGLEDLHRIAHSLQLSPLSVDDRVRVSPRVEHLIKMSCYTTLLRLGDLSRYRNQIRTKDRSWDSALAYYGLANDLYPNSGNAHNQMAVIAFFDGGHLNGLYHLHRAIAVKEPAPLARGNLETEYKKITTTWEKDKERGRSNKTDGESTLILWFVRLYAKFYKGAEFSSQDELENEVLGRLPLLVKEQGSEQTLSRFVLVNIAASYLAAERVKELGMPANEDAKRSYYFFLGFNLRVFCKLLEILLLELTDVTPGDDLPSDSAVPSARPSDRLTIITRRILPVLRQYMAWIVSSRNRLVRLQRDFKKVNLGCKGKIDVYIKAMWETLADALTKMITCFPHDVLTNVSYLLKEDENTVGFEPLQDLVLDHICEKDTGEPVKFSLYHNEDGSLKSRVMDPRQRNHPDFEMFARIGDILKCGVVLHHEIACPIELSPPMFIYNEALLYATDTGSDRQSKSSGSGHMRGQRSSFSTLPNIADYSHEVGPAEGLYPSESNFHMDSIMHQMVDSLLEPTSSRGRSTANNDTTSYGMGSTTASDIFGQAGLNLQPVLQSTPKTFPSLPAGIFSSPFTPQPNELQPTSPDRVANGNIVSPSRFSTTKGRVEAAAALEKMTGYGKPKPASWGRNNYSQPVNQILQESLARQFQQFPSSSGFTDSSSIYGNTPQMQNRSRGLKGGSFLHGNEANNSTVYPGASDFDKMTMLQSSIYNGSQNGYGNFSQTPPAGQGT